MSHPAHLQDFALRTFVKQQGLLVGGVQVLLDDFGFLLGHTHAVLQQVDLDVGGWGETPREEVR